MTGFGRTGAPPLSNLKSLNLKPLRLPSRRCPAGFSVCGQRDDGRLPAHGSHTDDTGDLRRFPGRIRRLQKHFFHGHSYTANPLGAAASLASLELLQSAESIRVRARLQEAMRRELQSLWSLPNVGDVRQTGLIAGIELVRDWRTREPLDLRERAGIRVCEAMARRGVLTRPVGNVIVLMPPYCTTPAQLRRMVGVMHASIDGCFKGR